MLTIAGSVAALGIALLAIWFHFLRSPKGVPNSLGTLRSIDQNLDDFIKTYWQRPIPPQGKPPASFSDIEARLDPEACGSCHPKQYADWKESLHSKAMGAGPWGQIIDLSGSSPDEAAMCMTCHAPLTEQTPWITTGAKQTQNPAYDPKLQLRGITCAACHVRGHRRFGPPKAEGAAVTSPGSIPHSGAERTPYFEKAEFCRDCHQFDPASSVLINGKPLQDTFREWRNSTWGESDTSCQQCHMPGRRHLWRGIHDAEWVRGAVRVEATLKGPSSGAGEHLEALVEITNAAVGHNFPSYVTPKVYLRAALLDGGGRPVASTQQERVIGWDARFEDGKWTERFDTRIAPGQKFTAKFEWASPAGATKARLWVEVHPDHFYHHEFYPAYLKGERLSPEGRKWIEQARAESGRTPYTLFDKVLVLN